MTDEITHQDDHDPFDPTKIPQLRMIEINNQVKELQTIIRDRETTRSDFVFCADRLIRLVVEEGLNQLPHETTDVTTPTDQVYHGLKFGNANCGVSIMRSGEAMERGLRDCCSSIRIGKILIRYNEDSEEPMVYYAKFPPDVSKRKVLLMYPLLNTGQTAIAAIRTLINHSVLEDNIIFLNLFATPESISAIVKQYPKITILSSEVDQICPNYFGQKYFGSE
ncbi:uncharacterized protein TRIADDRAFT_55590 [Trichoplax adhaerens]|uniref:Uracil phosphoribosyltransferase homolog n=1 Tax=Trichoplax adhaerens TaxID=10228 RepID=B3RVB0_TRIAD|nr:hypothetical protein TRIADDRAFT_55590 [Trichoplax adhaerens]EDV25471.1 hypothetical protein TRIADDRAFT_55590 [Trichoplax adhaerens]|eukprot:XP_002111504.1 hypothetical protein TRIADDRAFT_55590 [Trichoplax adhaerens]